MILNAMLFVLWFVVWIFLSWPPDIKDVIAGVIVSSFVTFMTVDVMSRKDAKARKHVTILGRIVRLIWFVWYLLIFIWECLKANVDVAYRVLHPRLPIRPGTIKVKVGLTSDIGLTFLANSITLTPGTTTVDIDRQAGFMYIHMLYVKQGQLAPKVVDTFEKVLKRIFE